jgi:hypothetical protein
MGPASMRMRMCAGNRGSHSCTAWRGLSRRSAWGTQTAARHLCCALPTGPSPCPAAGAGERLLLVSHGGALHSVHRQARGYFAPGRVANCSASVLRIDAPQRHAGQQREAGHQRQEGQQHGEQRQLVQQQTGQQQAGQRQAGQKRGEQLQAAQQEAGRGPCNGPNAYSKAAEQARQPRLEVAALWALLSWNEPLGDGGGEGGGVPQSFGGGAREG